jgi:hypothetical protein
MKKNMAKKYQVPKIMKNKVKMNFLSSRLNLSEGDLLSVYCGQCSLDCPNCVLPIGCDRISC